MVKLSKGRLVQDFFNRWSPQMAYTLGYFCADGSMFINPRGSRYKESIIKIKRMIGADNKITQRERKNVNWKTLFSLQMGSKEVYENLLKRGLAANKAKRLALPSIPKKYFCHFVRGYFDGDGCISYGYYKREDRKKEDFLLMLRFASGSKGFLESLSEGLSLTAGLAGGAVLKNKGGFHLVYSKKDTMKLFNFMYNRVPAQEYLERKYNKFESALKINGAVA